MRDRVSNDNDIKNLAGYFFQEPAKPKFKFPDYNKVLSLSSAATDKIEPWTKENIDGSLRKDTQDAGIGPKAFCVTIGQAVSGSDVFLPLFDSLGILGQEPTLKRLRRS